MNLIILAEVETKYNTMLDTKKKPTLQIVLTGLIMYIKKATSSNSCLRLHLVVQPALAWLTMISFPYLDFRHALQYQYMRESNSSWHYYNIKQLFQI